MEARPEVLVGSIDQGTTSTRFIIYDGDADAISSHQMEFTQLYPEAGYVSSSSSSFTHVTVYGKS